MHYDVVIATRNRAEVLAISIPTFLSQSRPPASVIVVDSSADHEPVRAAVQRATAGADTRVLCLHEPEPSSSRQRNIGLAEAMSPIVMMPDDDSLWFPGAAEAVMRVYERDRESSVGGVILREHREPPPGVLPASGADRRSLAERLTYRLSPMRMAIEGVVCPSPLDYLGDRLKAERAHPAWLSECHAEPTGLAHGFRMSFRKDAIDRVGGFDETLSAYALYEDFDVSFKIAATQLLVEASDAGVYHHRQPGARADARTTGAILMLNLAYVICRNTPPGDRVRSMLGRYAKVRYAQYRLRSGGEFGRERLEGFKAAMGCLDEMVDTSRDELPGLYTRLLGACLNPAP